ncbi:nitrilotriacetate monooxygenase [Arthrobacter sp. ZBG10]|uniref:LLM class flavin-dependent oxidoreductase n=1 Tax=unclassified Arthrobacter TaxID=235627 RepID=UPI000682FB33|nr:MULTISPECIES: LLM class flavin-dependent oxidoreductase [unclassified Arthrobacter]KNH22499.1 nitrilotriacetate monooxygenase [Arthrobacter sp. ZBG10]KQQ92266.1 nitrilotriacetate monooxygenase [Arthrobacter sp. Leaf141]
MPSLPVPENRPNVVAVELDGDGAHPAAWRHAHHLPDGLLGGARISGTVQAADIAGFHLATFRDSRVVDAGTAGIPGRIDAVQRAAFAAPITGSIGLVPEVDTLYTEPFHVATQLASLDYASQGRAGWLVSAANAPEEARAVGREQLAAAAAPLEAADAVEAGRRLWDSWEDDAVIRDASTGRYLDRDKLHYADFEGERFAVKGPAIIPRPLQGQLVVIAPAALLSTVEADVALASAATVDGLAAAASAAAATGVPRTLVELDVILDARGQTAAERLAELDRHEPWTGGARYVGSPAGLVSLLARLFDAADGVRLHPAVVDVDLPELALNVLPALRAAGLVSAPAAGTTLRRSFGLPRPANRYAAA